jgi:hypothetical protein
MVFIHKEENGIHTANVRHAWVADSAVNAMRKNLKLSSDGGDSVSKKCKR